MNTPIPMTTQDIKEIIIKSWSSLEPEAICKDVATKGKNIQLCIDYIAAKHLNCTAKLAKEYFHKEVTKYVKRLLSDRQVFKAEHVLRNVNRLPTFLFYEYAKNGTDNNSVRQAIYNHLKKINGDKEFDEMSKQLSFDLKLLHYCEFDPMLHEKYSNLLPNFSLEEFNRLGANVESIRATLAAEIFFQVTPNSYCIQQFNKHITWKYLFDNHEFDHIRKWLQVIQLAENSSNHFPKENANNFLDIALENVFAQWGLLDEQMIDVVLKWTDAGGYDDGILNELAKCGILLPKEIENVCQCLHRIFITESWVKNSHILSSKSFNQKIIEKCINDGRIELLAEDFIDETILESIANNDTTTKNPDLDLCVAIKKNSSNIIQLSANVSKYLSRIDEQFYQNTPLVYLFDMIAAEMSVSDMLANVGNYHRKYLNGIKFTRTLLEKLERSSVTNSNEMFQNDQKINLNELVQRFCNIDLTWIQNEGDENLNFSNSKLIEKYAKPARLDYLHYVRQRRSSYAAYIFMVDQLTTYSQLSARQIIVACADVAEIAAENFTDSELVAHCMAFIEMLGMNSSTVRAYIKCMHYVHDHNPSINVYQLTDIELLHHTEIELIAAWQTGKFNVRQFEAMAQVYKGRDLPMGGVGLLEECAKVGDWFQLILLATYFRYSVHQVIQVCENQMFCDIEVRSLGNNIARAVRYDISTVGNVRRNSSLSYRDRRKTMPNRSEVNSVSEKSIANKN